MECPKLASSTGGQFCHKNRLQQHAQKSALPLPLYQTVNVGPLHAPQYKSTVLVDGETFESSTTFLHLKEAEQDVARVALEGISEILKIKGVPLIQNDTYFCKSNLHEYAVKMKIEKPTYTTAESKGLFPLFITSITFDGKTYTGDKGKNKKEAEQLAARAAIESILASGTGTIMSQIIKSKGRLYAALRERNGLSGHVQNNSVESIAMANDQLPAVAYVELLPSGQHTNALIVNATPFEAIKPKQEVCELSLLGGSGTSVSAPPQTDLTVSTVVGESQSTTGRRKRANKNKRKARAKKARTDEQSPVQAETVVQEASSVYAETVAIGVS